MHGIFAPAFTDYWAPMIGLVGQLAARWAQIALPRRLPMDWAFPMIGFVGQLAARRLQVAYFVPPRVSWFLGALVSKSFNVFFKDVPSYQISISCSLINVDLISKISKKFQMDLHHFAAPVFSINVKNGFPKS